MALDTYDNLKAEIAEWLNRQDLTAKIPTFVSLLEAQVNRKLRVRDMDARATATLSEQFLALPADYIQLRGVQLNDTVVQPLQFASMNELDEIRRNHANVAGKPIAFSIVGTELEFAPSPDAEYQVEIVYLQKVPALSASNQTNWLLTKHPDLYLYGSLMQAAPYLHNDERIAVWNGGVEMCLEDIRVADERSRSGSTPLKVRIKPYGGSAARRL